MEISGLDDILNLADRIASFRPEKRSMTDAQHHRAISVLEILPAAAPVSQTGRLAAGAREGRRWKIRLSTQPWGRQLQTSHLEGPAPGRSSFRPEPDADRSGFFPWPLLSARLLRRYHQR